MRAAAHRITVVQAFLTIASAIVLLPSCRQPDPVQLAEVERSIGRYDSLADVVNGIDAGAYRRMDSIFGTQRAWFTERFRDTLDTSTALILGNYHRAMNGPLQDLLAGREGVLADIDSSRRRLDRLKHDLSQVLLEEEAASGALRTEQQHLQQLTTNTGVLQLGIQEVDAAWVRYHAAVDSLMSDSTSSILRP